MSLKNGLFVVLMGPDGSGKSAIVDLLQEFSLQHYQNTHHFHWRPGLFKKPSASTASAEETVLPPAENDYKYGFFISLLRFFYYLMDFIVGYWLIIFPKRYKKYLIIGERWYFDTIIQPYRYGFNLPKWFLQSAGFFIPKPDLVILLSADPTVIYARKPELSVDLIARQINEMKVMLQSMPNHKVIDTGINIDITKKNVLDVLADYKQG